MAVMSCDQSIFFFFSVRPKNTTFYDNITKFKRRIIMRKDDKELISEDLWFINDALILLINRHPKLLKEEDDLLKVIERRMNDIERRLEAY